MTITSIIAPVVVEFDYTTHFLCMRCWTVHPLDTQQIMWEMAGGFEDCDPDPVAEAFCPACYEKVNAQVKAWSAPDFDPFEESDPFAEVA